MNQMSGYRHFFNPSATGAPTSIAVPPPLALAYRDCSNRYEVWAEYDTRHPRRNGTVEVYSLVYYDSKLEVHRLQPPTVQAIDGTLKWFWEQRRRFVLPRTETPIVYRVYGRPPPDKKSLLHVQSVPPSTNTNLPISPDQTSRRIPHTLQQAMARLRLPDDFPQTISSSPGTSSSYMPMTGPSPAYAQPYALQGVARTMKRCKVMLYIRVNEAENTWKLQWFDKDGRRNNFFKDQLLNSENQTIIKAKFEELQRERKNIEQTEYELTFPAELWM